MTKLETAAPRALWVLLGAGFIIRLLFMGQNGFANDVSSFEAWALTLTAHPLWQFYGSTSFADYPPGYFYVLWIVGHVYALFGPHASLDLLKYLVKLPAVLVDLADGALLFAVVRRFASERAALGAAALFLLNPAIIFISASWGQVDSISAGLALVGVYLLLRSEDAEGAVSARFIAFAWMVLAYSLLIKPQAAVLIPLFAAFAFASRDRLRERLNATGVGMALGVLLVFVLTLPFHPAADAFVWLYHKYEFGKNVYAYNSVNAFNLWSIRWWQGDVPPGFWQKDSLPIFFLPQYVWGIVLLAAATALTIVRYLQTRTPRALVESAALLSLAFFMISTRMHERYVYEGLIFTIAAVPFARRYVAAALIFSFTLFVNLFYSMTYLDVVTHGSRTITNAQDLWPWVTHPVSLLNVATFFILGFLFLGQTDEAPATGGEAPVWLRARAWFNPREGLGSMLWPIDYVLAAALGAVSFVVSYVNYWKPAEKVFDEIYFARAAEEYLKGLYIYENTHPPLTKLIITFSTMLFGGLHGGDNAYGWRFLDVVFGALAVSLLYVFAKRLTRSSLFAAFAAVMLIADGMHFVQSRIATPEGIVVVFALGALYAFYRYWIALQSVERANEPNPVRRAGLSLAGALVLGFAASGLANLAGGAQTYSTASIVVFGFFFASGWYLLLRLWLVPRLMLPPEGRFITYAEGTQIFRGTGTARMIAPDGRIVGKDLIVRDEEATMTYRRDGTVSYATPEGSAVYSPGLVTDDEGEAESGRRATGWLVAFTVLLGALVASKWYGVMAYGVSFVAIAAVWSQRFWREGKTKLWGNPFGFRLDVSIAAIVFLSMSVYLCAWVPDLLRHINGAGGINTLKDLVYRQYSMYQYHDTLKATHPYSSQWWQWPLDLRPIAYYWHDFRQGAQTQVEGACCVAEIISLPNPLILWAGLIAVPLAGWLAWRERNKGYALLVLAYLFQWLPWARSPRITFAYHFYVNVPIIILCNVIVLQRLWQMHGESDEARILARIGVCGYVAAVVLAFVWFYPVLAGVPLHWNEWHGRMWLGDKWV
ncbi:MAG: phospholipid carrier-dependent glycosyltransferase [Candidatus Baltobacteraceae bacterium]